MAHHRATKKAARQNLKRRLHNRYYKKTMRTALRRLREEADVNIKEKDMPRLVSMIDKLAKRNVIHKNKAANYKCQLAAYLANSTKDASSADTKETAKSQAEK